MQFTLSPFGRHSPVSTFTAELLVRECDIDVTWQLTGEIEALAGCDRLTISPALLEELANDTGALPRCLSPDGAASDTPRQSPDEPRFRYDLNADAMATEKLAEGIRNFVADQVKLEDVISSR